MKKILVGLCGVMVLASCASQNTLVVQTDVDLNQYMGTWHEQVRLPNRFQKKCAADVAAHYERLADGTVAVTNQCVTKDGELTKAEGQARPQADQKPINNAILEVRFAPKWLSWLPSVWGDYWIMRIAGDYEYSLVGTPDRDYLWVLSREKNADPAIVQELLEYAGEQGFDIQNVVSNQPTN